MGAFSLAVVDTYDELTDMATDIVQETVARKPNAAITVPTGSTPLSMYQSLVKRVKSGLLDLQQVQIFCLDDYLGQTRQDEASLTRWLFDVFLEPAGIPESHIHQLPTMADDPSAAAVGYEAELAEAGGLDLAVVGLGLNGHIAFNEPGSSPSSRTRVVGLTEKSRDQSAAYWDGNATIPEKAMTMGIGTVLSAKALVLIVSGSEKAEVVRKSLQEPPSLDVPGSWLQTAGDRLHVIVDGGAASALDGY